jgi:hypothetical protein
MHSAGRLRSGTSREEARTHAFSSPVGKSSHSLHLTNSIFPNVVSMLDQLSPVAPARVRAVLLPIGQIKRARFLSFVDRLQPENVVRLGDISPDGRPNRSMLLEPSVLKVANHMQICSRPSPFLVGPLSTIL